MIRLEARVFARGSSAVLASAVMACCAGCTGQVYAGPANPANVEVQPLVAAPVEDDGDVVYVQDPPVVDIESYPTEFYGGVQVYYVGGYWYHHGPRGWAYYRQEPPELGRERQAHWQRDHDQRWADQRGGEHGGQAQQPEQRPGVTEAQPPDRRAPPPPPPQQALPGREERSAPPVPTVQPRRKVAPPPPAPKRLLPIRPAPAHPPAPQPEHR